MRIAVGLVFVALALIVAGQAVSVADFRLAQRWGLQEKGADPLYGRVELWTARWDVLTLWTLPVAGVLMLADHSWWPYAAMVGGGVYADTGGREAFKVIGLRQMSVRSGTAQEQLLAMGTYASLSLVGVLGVVVGLAEAV